MITGKGGAILDQAGPTRLPTACARSIGRGGDSPEEQRRDLLLADSSLGTAES